MCSSDPTLGKPSVEQITLDDLATLTGLKTAIKEGDTTIDQAFPAPEVDKAAAMTERIKAGAKPAAQPAAADGDLKAQADEAFNNPARPDAPKPTSK